MRKLLLVLFLIFPLCSAQASMVTLNMGAIYSGTGIPTNPAPWVKATFDDGGLSGSVVLTITTPGLTANERIGAVYFNLDPSLNPASLAFSAPTKTGAFDNPVISKGTDGYKADGDGKYDILIAFTEDGASQAFNGGESVQYTITLGSLTASSFDFLSTPAGGTGPFVTAAHLQSLGTNDGSAWATTPEPATMCLLGLGALSLRRRK